MSSLIEYFASLNPTVLKIACAVFAGAVLGLEREYHGHAAGLRTIMLVCLAPTLAVLVCDTLYDQTARGRVIQGVFAGVGFIGGGVILKHNTPDTVRGVTTAAVLWIATTLGFVFGVGMYLVGFVGLGISVFVVWVLFPVTRMFHTHRRAAVSITAADGAFSADKGIELLRALKLSATVSTFDFNAAAGTQTFCYSISYPTRDLPQLPARIREAFASIAGIQQIRLG